MKIFSASAILHRAGEGFFSLWPCQAQVLTQERIICMIELVNVEKTYYSKAGDIHALHKTNISIKAGEIFGIIGLSGAGKST